MTEHLGRTRLAVVIGVVVVAASGIGCGEQTSAASGDDPAMIECRHDQYLQDASIMASREYPTKMDAARAFIRGWNADGEPTDGAELVELEDPGGRRVAVRLDGRTVATLTVEGGRSAWAVGGYVQC